MFCPKCGKELSNDAKFCQYCGNQIDDTSVNNSNSNNNSIDKTKPPGCLIVFVVCILIFFFLSIITSKPFEEDQYAQELLARTLSQQEVQQRLSNPKSADFNRSEDVVTKIGNMTYNVKSSLYAENMFGATVKLYYSCDVKLEDENSGTVYNIKIK